MSAGASISGIGGLFYMVMFIAGICFKAGKKLRDTRLYYVAILVISFTLLIGLLSILFVYGISDVH
ncbi:MAG: hypothetical protein M3M88_06315 [Thermoproteota archaeon]|nr:hypothetical protein [Thermoproteota archaeon]